MADEKIARFGVVDLVRIGMDYAESFVRRNVLLAQMISGRERIRRNLRAQPGAGGTGQDHEK